MDGSEFHALVKRLGLRQRELAALMGVSQRTLQRWANDPRHPIPGSVACALRCFVLLSQTSRDFHAVSKINFEQISQV